METVMPLWSTMELWLYAEVSLRPTSNDTKTHSPVICRHVERWVIILGSVGGVLSPSLVVDKAQVISKAHICNICNNFGCVRLCVEFVDVIQVI